MSGVLNDNKFAVMRELSACQGDVAAENKNENERKRTEDEMDNGDTQKARQREKKKAKAVERTNNAWRNI